MEIGCTVTGLMEIGCPDSIIVENKHHEQSFIIKHFSPTAFFLLFFCIAWDSFLFFWYFGEASESMPLIHKIFPIAHVAVGIGLTYYTICLFINKTKISIQGGQLIVKDFPLPMGNSKVIPHDDITQFYVQEKVTKNEDSSSISYILMAITKNKKLKKVIKGLNEKEEGLYLEQELEKNLKIKPQPVKGEVN